MVTICASVANSLGEHRVSVSTAGKQRAIEIPPRESGYGSSANGGELLCLAVATCYCNDLYREAGKRAIEVLGVSVDVNAVFGAEGEPASSLSYRVKVTARAGEAAIRALALHTDAVAEIHNTLRRGMKVELEGVEVAAA